ncbi:MAG: DUF58 domain-containing protein [Nitriliruptoraceae bacterium]|nr:DUF58 domain-containing protein [Nitriliruptoraceae bacterium]
MSDIALDTGPERTEPRPIAVAADPQPSAADAPERFARPWWAGMTPVPTLRAAGLVAVTAVGVTLLGLALGLQTLGPLFGLVVPLLGVAVLVVLDAWLAPAPWRVPVLRELPARMPLGGEASIRWVARNPGARAVTIALADDLVPSLGVERRRVGRRVEGHGSLQASMALRPSRRGTFRPTWLTVRVVGPLGLASRQAVRELPGRLEVHPRFPSRDAAELRLRRARTLTEGLRSVRARGGGTEFEALREYVQGDDVRHVDWVATGRAGHPVVRTFRAERNQTVVVLLDTGRVVAGLVEDVPRLDHAMDAALALTTVATGLGDRVGMVCFGGGVRAVIPPRRQADQISRVSRAMHALEPELAESGYREAFRTTLARFRRRSLLVLLTELADEAMQESLLPALPTITREHAVVVASVRDPALTELRDRPPALASDVYVAAAAAQVHRDRQRAAARLRGLGAHVIDAPPSALPAQLMDLYLDVKSRGAL